MAAKKASSDPGVDALVAALDHPLAAVIAALRQLVLAADASISEGVKWNSPSFRTSGDFATLHLRAKGSILLILHLGARPRTLPKGAIADPQGLLQWRGADRASIAFTGTKDVRDHAAAVTAIVRQWIRHVP